jgi:hypothetical protein
MKISSNEKGKRLEKVVESIEKAIIQFNPRLKNANFSIKRNKIEIIEGVKYEADLYIKVDFGSGYELIFIFECKNWDNEKVNPKELSYFSEKINAFKAQRGFFVYKDISEFAIARAKLDLRIELVKAKDFLGDDIPFEYPIVIIKGLYHKQYKIILTIRGRHSENSLPLDSKNIESFWEGNKFLFQELIENLVNQLMLTKESEIQNNLVEEGRYTVEFESKVDCENLIVNGHDIESILCQIKFTYIQETIYPKVLVRFEVEGRGKYLEIEFDEPERGRMRIVLASSEFSEETQS